MLQVPHWRSGQKGKCSTCQRLLIIPSLSELGYEMIIEPLGQPSMKRIHASLFFSLYAISFYTMISGLFTGILCKPYIKSWIQREKVVPIVIKKELPKPPEIVITPEPEKVKAIKETLPALTVEIFPGGWYSYILQSLDRLEKNFYGKKYRVEEGREEIVIQAIHSAMKFASFIKEYRQEARQLHNDLREIESGGKNLMEWIAFKMENKTLEAKGLGFLKEFALSGNIAIPKEILKATENASYNIQHEIESGIVHLKTIREIHRCLSELHQEFTMQKNTILQLRKEWSEQK